MKNSQKSIYINYFFCLSAALLVTFAGGYTFFSIGANVETYLVFLKRINDPHFLPKDVAINQFFEHFNARIFSIMAISFLSQFFKLHNVIFFLTLAVNIGTSLIAYHTCKYLYKNEFAGLVGSLFSMTLQTFFIISASSTSFYNLQIHQQMLSQPFVLAAFYYCLKKNAIGTAICAGLATLIHSLIAVQLGLLFLASIFLVQWMHQKDLKAWLPKYLVGLFFFAFLFSLTGLDYLASKGSLSNEEFIKIFRFRIAHQTDPSYAFFHLEYYLPILGLTIGCLIAFFAIFQYWKKLDIARMEVAKQIQIMLAILIGVFIGGYVLVEIIPSRLWVTAQVLRNIIIVKWMFLCFIAGYAGFLISDLNKRKDGFLWYFSSLSPVTMLLFLGFDKLGSTLSTHRRRLAFNLISMAIFIALIIQYGSYFYLGYEQKIPQLLIFVCLTLCLLHLSL